jgi:8-oxo-dGTP pyrophosphatase MutT (NUDIX family)
MGTIHAVIFNADHSPSIPGAKAIAGYRLDIDHRASGRVEFYPADTPSPSEHVVDAIALDDDCVATLLAQAGAKLKSGANGGEIDEPPLKPPSGKWPSAGMVLVDDRGYVTIREPANHYGGVEWSYAKGRLDRGETPQQTAHRELREETGLTGRILELIGDFEGGYSLTRFYVGVRTGDEQPLGPETWAVRTVSPLTAMQMLNQQKDRDVLVRLVELAARIVDWSWTIDGRAVRCRLVDGRMVCRGDDAA